jgi:ribonuclease R
VAAAGHDDVFISGEAMGGALHGDRVRVGRVTRSHRGLEGQVTKVVARRSPRVAGVLRRKGRSAWLEPDDTRMRGPIVIVEGKISFEDGDGAVIEITRFPELPDENPEGQIVAVLGKPGEPRMEVQKILIREQITEEHPTEAINEAEAMAASLIPRSLRGRLDLRGIPLPTIDPEDARDHDDALWVEKTEKGYRATVAIADVSEFVQEGQPLDVEAQTRGCTIYLPDRAIPMLPTALAAELCSLLPEQDRLCLAVIAEFNRRGEVESFQIAEGVMRSAAMLTYEGVARTLGFIEEGPVSRQAEALKSGLRVVDELARKLRQARMTRGALDMELPEPHVLLDKRTGMPTDVVRRAANPGVKRAYQMVEELMIVANELVAQWLSSRRALAIYRVHAPPDPDKLERLGELTKQLGIDLDVSSLLEPKGLGRWLARIKEHPRQQSLEQITLRSLKQAEYDIVNRGHFGLASDAYLHFTSPIRRYPDLIVHRLVKHLLRGGAVAEDPTAVELMRSRATESSQRERAAMVVEREVLDLYRVLLMLDHVGEEFDGRITGITPGGIYVALDAPFVDVHVRLDALGPDAYQTTEGELSVVGTRSHEVLRLGDRIRVVIEDAAILRRMVVGRRAGHKQTAMPNDRTGRPAKRPGRPSSTATTATRAREDGRRKPSSRGSKPQGRRKR